MGQELSELKLHAVDLKYVLTGHNLSNSAFKLWSGQDLSELKVKTRTLKAVDWNHGSLDSGTVDNSLKFSIQVLERSGSLRVYDKDDI